MDRAEAEALADPAFIRAVFQILGVSASRRLGVGGDDRAGCARELAGTRGTSVDHGDRKN